MASGPNTVTVGGPAFSEENIEPDTISVLVYTSQNYVTEEEQYMASLIEAFAERYPQHKVNIETYEYSENYGAQVAPRFLTAEAPAIFHSYVPDLDNEEDPYMIDLSPLYASLELNDYLFLQDYYEKEVKDDEGVYDIPTGFYFEVGYVNPDAAAERSMEPPAFIDDYDQLIEWEKAMPGTVEMYTHEMGQVLGRLKPEISDNEDIDALESYVIQYAEMDREGYFEQGGSENLEYNYSDYLLEFDGSYTEGTREYSQRGTYTMVPVLTEGKIACQTLDHYSISSHISENQQKLAMLFLRFMMSEYGQNIIHVQTDNRQPVHKTVLAQYIEANPDFAFLTGEYADKLKRGSSSFHFNDLDEMIRDEDTSMDEIRAYVRQEYEERWSD